MDIQTILKSRNRATEYLNNACIAVKKKEINNMEIIDFGLGCHKKIGLQLLVYINTKRVCAKELILFPGQLCPEHKHPPVKNEMGKEETFCCRWGTVYLYTPGKPCKRPRHPSPKDSVNISQYFTK